MEVCTRQEEMIGRYPWQLHRDIWRLVGGVGCYVDLILGVELWDEILAGKMIEYQNTKKD